MKKVETQIDNNQVNKIIKDCLANIEREQFKGYDPYDTLNSFIPFQWGGRWAQVAAIQFQVRNPINIRRLIGIKKEYSAKGLALLLQGISIKYQQTKDESLLPNLNFLFEWFLANRQEGYSGYCWSVHYPLAWSLFSRPKLDPSAVLACVVHQGMYEYFKAVNNPRALEVLKGIEEFILTHVPQTITDEGICFSYTTRKKDVVFNANMYVAEMLIKNAKLFKQQHLEELADKCVAFNLHYQKADGSWNYRRDMASGNEKPQIDFHQGFILNSLFEYYKLSDNKKPVLTALEKGLHFYVNNQITPSGKVLWRYPKLYPIDIHNQSVAIWVLSKLSAHFPEVREKAEKTLNWTIKNLYNPNGYFYYQKTRIFTNKISFIRWNQAWMVMAMVNYLNTNNK